MLSQIYTIPQDDFRLRPMLNTSLCTAPAEVYTKAGSEDQNGILAPICDIPLS